ncbi:MAG: DUF805 domain-containing protein [Paracoccaceae bacterium]
MGFRDAVRTCLRKYATFSGRASRSEYWWFALFLVLGSLVIGAVDSLLFGTSMVEVAPGQFELRSNGPLAAIFSLAMLLPALAAGWRRMHDSGRAGIYLLYPLIVMVGMLSFIGFLGGTEALMTGDFGAIFAGVGGLIALLGAVVLLISPLLVLWWLTRPSQPGANAYGPNPQQVTS